MRYEPVWYGATLETRKAARRHLQTRYRRPYEVLEGSLESVDPADMVYPGNPGEYNDVVLEILTLTCHRDCSFTEFGRHDLMQILERALHFYFGEPVDGESLRSIVADIHGGPTALSGDLGERRD